MRTHHSLPICIIARIDSSVSRLLVTFGDNFLSSGCAGQGMRSRPFLTVYMIAGIDLGIMRHCATSCDIVRQLSGVDSRRQGTNDFMRGMTSIPCKTDCSASSEKPVEWKKLIDKGYTRTILFDPTIIAQYFVPNCPELSQVVLNCLKFAYAYPSPMQEPIKQLFSIFCLRAIRQRKPCSGT